MKPAKSLISIHTPARGVTEVEVFDEDRELISIHTPARGVTFPMPKPVSGKGDFNPHSRTGSDEEDMAKANRYLISIHTPARGVTANIDKNIFLLSSIFTKTTK